MAFGIQSGVSIASPEARTLFGRQWHVFYRCGSQYRFLETGYRVGVFLDDHSER